MKVLRVHFKSNSAFSGGRCNRLPRRDVYGNNRYREQGQAQHTKPADEHMVHRTSLHNFVIKKLAFARHYKNRVKSIVTLKDSASRSGVSPPATRDEEHFSRQTLDKYGIERPPMMPPRRSLNSCNHP